MKKTYMTPMMEIENEEVDTFLLAGSIKDTLGDEYNSSDVSYGRGFDFDED